MITRTELESAIAECLGKRDPNANTSIMLASFYTILDHLYPDEKKDVGGYSYAAPPQAGEYAHIESESEFARTVEGLPLAEVWTIIDELVATVSITQPAVYRALLRRFDELR